MSFLTFSLTLDIHFLSIAEAAAFSRSLQSLCSRNAASTNTDCTSDGLIFGLFLTNCSTSFEAVFFFFVITGQVCVL